MPRNIFKEEENVITILHHYTIMRESNLIQNLTFSFNMF